MTFFTVRFGTTLNKAYVIWVLGTVVSGENMFHTLGGGGGGVR